MPFPVFFTRTSKSTDGEETESFSYNEYKIGEFDNNFAKLSAYGLPEPDSKTFEISRSNFFRFIFIISGSLLILIALVMIVRKQKVKM